MVSKQTQQRKHIQCSPFIRYALFICVLVLGSFKHGSSECPALAILHTSYTLTGEFSLNDYKDVGLIWRRPNGGQYVVTCNPLKNCSSTAGYSANVDSNTSTLTIDEVQITDVGPWILQGALNSSVTTSVCELTAALPPSCNIQADKNTDTLEAGVELNLTIHIRRYYCSKQHRVNITTGEITNTLNTPTASDISNSTVVEVLNITEAHFGDVKVNFECRDRLWNLTCFGVTRLAKITTSSPAPTTRDATTTPGTSTSRGNISSSVPTTRDAATTPPMSSSTGQGTTPEPGQAGGLDIGLIVAVVVVCVFLIVVVVLLICCRDKLKKTYKYIITKKSAKPDREDKMPMEE